MNCPLVYYPLRIWALRYRPFLMGGDVNRPMATTVIATGPYALGLGYSGYLVASPSGKTHVAEATSGALIGPSLAEVREDVRTGDPALMVQQVQTAQGEAVRAENVSPQEFWETFQKGKG